jgi:hypothetical protein
MVETISKFLTRRCGFLIRYVSESAKAEERLK